MTRQQLLLSLAAMWAALFTAAAASHAQRPSAASRSAAAPGGTEARADRGPLEPVAVSMGVRAQRELALTAAAGGPRAEPVLSPALRPIRGGVEGSVWLTRVGDNLAHVEWSEGQSAYALQSDAPGRPLRFVDRRVGRAAPWRIHPSPHAPDHFWLESIEHPGFCATFHGGGVYLLPVEFAATQQWWFAPPPLPPPPPPVRSGGREVIPNPPLPPARVELANPTDETLLVLLTDLRNPAAATQIRIAPRSGETVTLERDSGATVIERYEMLLPDGTWQQDQRTYPIPPVPLYDASVYEVFLQSIAIDRTGTSPNPIEDVNYQPRSVGYFQLPPGASLPEVARIDVAATALAAGNPGGVRPLAAPVTAAASLGGSGPLEAILREIQSRRRAF